MMNAARCGIILFCSLFFTGFNVFAQPADTQAVKSEFQKMDTNKDGFVTSEEMQAYQAKRFNELDKDKNGALDSKELSADKTNMQLAADKNKDGKVTKQESDS
ncbi:hypothetical protein EPN54_04710, partial [bacterium]